jgi:CheY-like chemotaxis protein
VIMPGGMSGRALAEAVGRQRPNLKVLYTSGYTDSAVVHHGRLDEGVLLLTKPYRKPQLAEMVRQALGGGAG